MRHICPILMLVSMPMPVFNGNVTSLSCVNQVVCGCAVSPSEIRRRTIDLGYFGEGVLSLYATEYGRWRRYRWRRSCRTPCRFVFYLFIRRDVPRPMVVSLVSTSQPFSAQLVPTAVQVVYSQLLVLVKSSTKVPT